MLAPQLIEIKIYKALSYYNIKYFKEAIKYSKETLIIKPTSEAYNLIGNSLNAENKYEESLEYFNNSINLDPTFKSSWLNKAVVLNSLKKFTEASECFKIAIKLDENDAHSHFEYALFLLRNGEYEKGWCEYEWRWKWDGFTSEKRKFVKPQWTGKNSSKSRLVLFIHAEQGFGDTIQFCRYILIILEMNIDIIFEVDKSLKSIVELSYPQIKVINKGDSIPEHDFHCPLMSLPLVFKTVKNSIPQKIPYLISDTEKNEKWENIIKTRKNIGIFWRGNTLQANYDNRCIPLKYFEKILNKDINLYALQKEISKEEKKLLRKYNITEFTEKLTNFAETAAYCSQMDLIITVDTSVAHLASAIGLKVWILIPYIPDFRWFWDTEKSPWYPNIKIFRQKKPEDWNSVVKEVVSEMELFFNT